MHSVKAKTKGKYSYCPETAASGKYINSRDEKEMMFRSKMSSKLLLIPKIISMVNRSSSSIQATFEATIECIVMFSSSVSGDKTLPRDVLLISLPLALPVRI